MDSGMKSILARLPRLSRVEKAAKAVAELLGPRLAMGLGAAAVVGLLLVLLAREIREGELDAFDTTARLTVHGVSSPAATAFFERLTDLGSPLFLVPATLLSAFGFLLRKRIRGALLLVVTMLGVSLLNWLLKLAFARARPEPFFGLAVPDSYSFPSGHALASFCFYGSLAALLAVRVRSRPLRVVIWTVGALMVLSIGFSRVYLGVHYVTDVVAGFGVGFVWVLTVASADRLMRRRLDKRGARAAVAEAPPGPA
jgi:undecaprenyl-diphosphatase